ncbi:hypothetical protein B0T22DRAFT_481705 [Podospora appendiculata]|uniref:Uncharacterized protein n=1 Tax=Podospora appendiculata TaxID=314037 RepID=A0AAE0XDU6_9PEZI|nr:hypothetical protein B0T22DRAFT_481705 [Podospora appendiculata]
MDAGANEPWIPDFSEDSPWRWEWWKVGLEAEDLFITIEANDAAYEAKNVEDFYARLALRRDERL